MGTEIFCVKILGRRCQPGIGLVRVWRTYFYRRDKKLIIQILSGASPEWPELLVVRGDRESAEFLEDAILDPKRQVRVTSGENALILFEGLARSIEENANPEALIERLESCFN